MTNDAQTLSEIRKRHERAPVKWQSLCTGVGFVLQAIDRDSMAPDPLPETVANLPHNDQAATDFLTCAHKDVAFLLVLIVRAIAKINQMAEQNNNCAHSGEADSATKMPKNYAANCAILCKEPAFKKFLKSAHGLGHASDDATAAKVREMMGIASRKQLNNDPAKSEIWLKLVREFNGWKPSR